MASLPEKLVSGYFSKSPFSSLWDAAFLQECDVFFRGRKFEVCEYLRISDWKTPNFLGTGMWKAVTLDVKFTSLSQAQKFHLRAVCQKNLFAIDI